MKSKKFHTVESIYTSQPRTQYFDDEDKAKEELERRRIPGAKMYVIEMEIEEQRNLIVKKIWLEDGTGFDLSERLVLDDYDQLVTRSHDCNLHLYYNVATYMVEIEENFFGY